MTYNTRGVIFSPHTINKPQWLMASEYSALAHPISFFYVYLLPKRELERIKNEKYFNNYLSYLMEEEEFLGNLKKWDVELEEIISK